ncbi:MAG TPA: C2 family cysteine protease, partial [Bryobacteraceae bacterium]
HADPVGGDDFNKKLSGRRAIAIYALLTRRTDLWEQLHSAPLGNDDWGKSAIGTMLGELGFSGAGAIQAYQASKGLAGSGQADAATRALLFADYMDSLCGADFVLDPEDDFLARGQDAQGKGDYQGCSDFNLNRIFSQQESQTFDQADNHLLRNIANAPNRRVMALLFQPGIYVNPLRWPCPRASEGVGGCLKRFWSDSSERRRQQSVRREYQQTQDTFACRFYDRITSDSPCERRNSVTEKVFQLQIRDHERNPLPNCAYTLTLQGKQTTGSTDDSGFIEFQTCVDGAGELKVNEQVYKLTFSDSLPNDVRHTQGLLNALGFNAGPLDGRLGRRTEDALKSFQRTHELRVTGKIDPPTSKALRKEQIIQDLDDSGTSSDSSSTTTAPPSSGSPKHKTRVKATPAPAPPAPPVSAPSPTPAPGPTPTPPGPTPTPPPGPAPTPTVIQTNTTSRVDLPPPHDDLSAAIIRRFADMDSDKDGFLGKKEIDVALGKTSFTGVDAAMVATLKKVFGDFEEFSDDEWGPENDGITQADVTAYDRLRIASPDDKKLKKVTDMFGFAKQKITDTAGSLFVGDPNVFQVQQGMIGDCWFLAALVAVGDRNKADIVKLVAPKAGTTDQFDVTLPGAGKTVTVSKPTDGEIAIFATVGSNGFWLATIEKAYGASVNQDAYFFVDTSPTDAADGGGFLGTGIKLMTGHDSTRNTISLTRGSVLRAQLTAAFASKKIATAGIDGGILADYLDDGLPMGHAYTVLSFDSARDVIRLRNPWGHTGPKNSIEVQGAFEMKMSDFFNDFNALNTED